MQYVAIHIIIINNKYLYVCYSTLSSDLFVLDTVRYIVYYDRYDQNTIM